jgi:hypothetical protein
MQGASKIWALATWESSEKVQLETFEQCFTWLENHPSSSMTIPHFSLRRWYFPASLEDRWYIWVYDVHVFANFNNWMVRMVGSWLLAQGSCWAQRWKTRPCSGCTVTVESLPCRLLPEHHTESAASYDLQQSWFDTENMFFCMFLCHLIGNLTTQLQRIHFAARTFSVQSNTADFSWLGHQNTICGMDFRPLKKMPLTRDPVENMIHLQMIFIFKMVIFHSYVKLPEGHQQFDGEKMWGYNIYIYNGIDLI